MNRNKRGYPYKNLKFVVAVVAVGAVAIRVGRKLLTKAEVLHPGVYIDEIPTGTRPIEGVGTSTAAFVGSKDKRLKPPSRRARVRYREPKRTRLGTERHHFGHFAQCPQWVESGHLTATQRSSAIDWLSYERQGAAVCPQY